LSRLGLGQYEQVFRQNDIDAEVLKRLTAEDLRELGVASVGHRRRLLDAIVAFGAAAADEPRPQADASAAPAQTGEAHAGS
jgi:hypothetical protein